MRRAICIRFNNDEFRALRELCDFWKKDEKEVLKFAWAQLYLSTKQINDKMNKGSTCSTEVSPESSPSLESSPSSNNGQETPPDSPTL